MSDLVARFRAEADSDAAFEGAMKLVEQTQAEIARLRAVLEWMNAKGGLGLDVHQRIYAALGKPLPY